MSQDSVSTKSRRRRPPISPENIPASLRDQPRWVGWTCDLKQIPWDQVFVGIRTGEPVHIDQEQEFVPFDEALAAYQSNRVHGLAFAADDSYVVLKGMPYESRTEKYRVQTLHTYAELEDRGEKRGGPKRVTVIGRAQLPAGEWQLGKRNPQTLLSGRQFIPVNGSCVTSQSVGGYQDDFARLHKKYIKAAKTDKTTPAAAPVVTSGSPPKPEHIRLTIPIANLRTEAAEGVRVKQSDETVDRYAEEMEGGKDRGPVVVFRDESGVLWLADGLHRVGAARKLGRTEIEAEVRQGGEREAFFWATQANVDHGLVAGLDDRKKAATRMLQDPDWSQWSDRKIARQCGLPKDGKDVGKLRAKLSASLAQMSADAATDTPQTRLVERKRNGKVTVFHQKVRTPTAKKKGEQEKAPAAAPVEPTAPDATVTPVENPTVPLAAPEPAPVVSPSPPQPPADKRPWADRPADIDFFDDSGLVFHLNREFLHPLGLALDVQSGPDGTKTIILRDCRAERGKMAFDPTTYELGRKKFDRFMREWGAAQIERRFAEFGRLHQ